MVIVRLGCSTLPISQPMQLWRSCIPVWDAVGRGRVLEIEIATCLGRLPHPRDDGGTSAMRYQLRIVDRLEKLEFFGEPHHRPRQPARPGRERRVALL